MKKLMLSVVLFVAVALNVTAVDRNSMIITPKIVTSGDVSDNDVAPTGALAGSGWDMVIPWNGSATACPIGAHHAITAAHVGGAVGETLEWRGVIYTVTKIFNDVGPGYNISDLRILEIDGTFPEWATLNTENEMGKGFISFGRGLRRGDPVILADDVTTVSTNSYVTNIDIRSLKINKKLLASVFPEARISGHTMTLTVTEVVTNVSTILRTNGYAFGSYDGTLSWGTNVVTQVNNGGGELIGFQFGKADDTAALAFGDSAGICFTRNSTGSWNLIGINYGIEGPFSLTPDGPQFFASLWDKSGLYEYGGQYGPQIFYPEDGVVKPSWSFFTSVRARAQWITGVLASSGRY